MVRIKTLVAITPAYNEAKIIKKTILNILRQSYPITAYVIINDGSTDKTVEVIESINDHRVHVIHGERTSLKISSRRVGLKEQKVPIHGIPMVASAMPHWAEDLGMQFLNKLVPNWDYLIKVDADILISPFYCEYIIRLMERDPLLMMAGARYLQTPDGVERAPIIHNRNCNHIIRGDFYREVRDRGITYNNIHGEIALERIAWGTGRKAMPIERLTAIEVRKTSDKSWMNPYQKGIEDFRLGNPFLIMLYRTVTGHSKRTLLRLTGWLNAFFFRYYSDFLTKQEKAVLRRMFLNLIREYLKRFKRRRVQS